MSDEKSAKSKTKKEKSNVADEMLKDANDSGKKADQKEGKIRGRFDSDVGLDKGAKEPKEGRKKKGQESNGSGKKAESPGK